MRCGVGLYGRNLGVWIALVERDGSAELREALSAFRNWREEIKDADPQFRLVDNVLVLVYHGKPRIVLSGGVPTDQLAY